MDSIYCDTITAYNGILNYNYIWDGDDDIAAVGISTLLQNQVIFNEIIFGKTIIQLGGFRVRILDKYYSMAVVVCREEDFSELFLRKYKLKKFLRQIEDNVLITLHIWGLENSDLGGTPVWKNVVGIRHLRKLLRKDQ